MRLRRLVLGLAVASAACDVKVSDTRIALDLAEGRASDEWSRAYTLPEGGRIDVASSAAVPATVERQRSR